MHKHIITVLALLQCVLPAAALQPRLEVHGGLSEKAGTPTIVVTKLDLRDKTLELSYEIRNDTKRDFWIMEGLNGHNITTAAFMDNDNQTLLLRSRLDVPPSSLKYPPQGPYPIFEGAYVRLPPGGRLSESVSFRTPVRPQYWIPVVREERGLEHATRLAIEMGYYEGDPLELIRSRLLEEAKVSRKLPLVHPNRPATLFEWFDGLGMLQLNEMNERLRARDDRILLPYTGEILKGEESLRVTVDDLRIPYVEGELDSPSRRRYPPNLTSCTRIRIQYRPSALDFFFPYGSVQRLLSDEEIRRLSTANTVVVEDTQDLKAIIDDVGKGIRTSDGAIRKRNVANLVCYDGSEHLLSFSIYNHSTSLVDSQRNLFTRDSGFQSIGNATPDVRPIELRVRCADNLKDLWHRLRLFQQAEIHRLKKSPVLTEVVYPESGNWCDAMVPAYKSVGMLEYWIKWTYRCPGAGEGKCHYAMNPNCEPNSPPDTVLLFETKASWNQYGGPELFTFNNHDPKGGCVLLNDGTVKFIRTKDELQQLRWK